jgi:uncharacterized protein (DUF4415 family)
MKQRKRGSKRYPIAGETPLTGGWMVAERGDFYRPVKEQITLRLDKDVITWFRARGGGYQTRINDVLRDYVGVQLAREAKK